MKYEMLYETEPYKLNIVVNKYIAAGWEPLGGVSICVSSFGHFTFAQAMIKKA
jgi:hypothetical protein